MADLYLVDLDTLDRIRIQFIPTELIQGRRPTITDLMVIGKNNPDFGYSAGSDDLTFELDFYSDDENKEDVRDKCNFLKSLAYNAGDNKAASKVQLIFGELYKDEKWIVKSVQVNYSLFNKLVGHLPQQAYVRMILGLDPDDDIVKLDVRENRIL